MKLLANKFLILGTLALLLVSIPLTLYFVKRQQDVRSSAAPTSKLSFNPESPNTSTTCTAPFINLMIDPGSNLVSIVDFTITYDPTKIDITQIKESAPFTTVVRQANISNGTASMSVSIGPNVTNAVQTITKVATITYKAKVAGTAQIQIDQTKSRVFSLAPADKPTANVLISTSPSNINIGTGACPVDGGTPVPTNGTGTTPAPTSGTGTTPAPTSGTGGTQGQAPICTSFTVAPSATGSAPFSVIFTASGNDPDTTGVISSALFTFGDGQTQNVTQGLNLKNVTVQQTHTYQTANSYAANVVFTDLSGNKSTQCSQNVVVTGATGSATIAPTAVPTAIAKPTAPPAQPTIPPTGSIIQTVGIIGVTILTVIGGFFLLAL